ncbi:MerR family transcriptional regulator [Halalkalibacterium halodurans]|uniref:Transcriptional activator of multidrug-efflux transporter genes n=1 Tax=Halalkalibacterium halodurans (strain ATCC BAA-125 / DSM 18197 / FERM 7344 / JCM 9153 / C-125) TaxID=272558 RepID=Q9KFR9_HALH5|nr:MerR family transcriptional regulator [Halalkalibacterium halodurans]MED4173574.1 MerR family transcriptional regulator [Halalkalibacterium halodurans]BAB04127.1 transcriptional activator of multidrug-efflux transporter genes [Halalkalibacterium halodurans C-125]
MAMKVKEVAELVGTSVRTLHHYDEIGLLIPDETTEAGYRLYSDDNLEMLQQILFFKELGFSLKQIKEIVYSPTFDRLEALSLHRNMLLEKRSRIDQMVETIDKTIKHLKGEIHMTNEEKFAGFDFSHNPYEQEARERWGDEAVDRSNEKLGRLTKEEQQALGERMNQIYRRLAEMRHLSPQSQAAQEAIKDWYEFLNNNFGHHYTLEAFKGLGQMYVEDERFTQNIDQFGEGLALFMSKAMAAFVGSTEKIVKSP